MSVYEQRLAQDKDEIRRRVAAVGEAVGSAIRASVEALLTKDEAACSRVILGDLPINRETRAIDKLCHAFVARHLPSAGHLRFVSSVLQMNVALERIGDYAATIAREGVQLEAKPLDEIAGKMRLQCSQACAALSNAVRAFTERDEQLARSSKLEAKALEAVYSSAFDDLVARADSMPTTDLLALLTGFHRLGRVGDQAKNLCEETLFELTGETKPPKQYRIHFVDARGTLVAPLAVALARKAFPESGDYSCSGFQPGNALAPELSTLCQELALDLSVLKPNRLDSSTGALQAYHVVVCLSAEARRQIPKVPFSTVALVWDLPPWSEGAPEELPTRLRSLSQFLSSQISDLMVTMRGQDAS